MPGAILEVPVVEASRWLARRRARETGFETDRRDQLLDDLFTLGHVFLLAILSSPVIRGRQ